MKHILSYNDLLESTRSEYNPLSKLLSAGYTSDSRYVIVEGRAYSCETGERAPLNEEWSVSDILHTGADVLSMGLDIFLFPGAGMTVDILNTISYVIEAQFAPPEKQGSLYIMALISYAFIILPGPLQALSIPLKRFIKSGASKLAAKGPVKKGLEFIAGKMSYILKELPKKIKSALSSKLGQTLLGKTGVKKVISAMKSFTSKVGSAFNRIMGRPDDVVKSTLAKSSVKTLTKDALKKVLPENTINLLKRVFTRPPKIPAAANKKILKKLGYVPGKPYRYIDNEGKAATVIISSQNAKGEVVMKYVNQTFKSGKKNDYDHIIPLEEFVSKAIGAPWGRRGYTPVAPFFVKQYARMINSAGEIDPALLDQLDDLDPNATSAESLAFLQAEVGSYEGDTGTYTVDQDVTSAQTMLSKVVYPITIDGKFGPQTKEALEKFQQDHGLSTSLGKLDNATMLKLKEVSGL